MSDVTEFRYEVSIKSLTPVFLLSVGFAAWSLYMTFTNDRGLVINNVIEFSVQGAAIFYGLLAGLMFVSTVFILLVIVSKTLSKEQEFVRLTSAEIEIPKGLFKRTILKIPFSRITKLSVREMNTVRFLAIQHKDGRTVSLAEVAFPTKGDFEALAKCLADKTMADA